MDAPAKRNSAETKQARLEYAQWMSTTDIRRTLIFVDEADKSLRYTSRLKSPFWISGFNLYTRRTRGRALVGSAGCRHLREEPKPHHGNLPRCWSGVTKKLLWRPWTERNLATSLTIWRQSLDNALVTVLMGNASVHRATKICNCEIRKMPAYSPFLNPIEMTFSQSKCKSRGSWMSACRRFWTARQLPILELHSQLEELGFGSKRWSCSGRE